MQFQSIANPELWVSLRQAVMQPLAKDGSLFMPRKLPQLPRAFFNNLSEMTISESAYVVAMMLVGSDIEPDALKEIIENTFDFDVPLRQVDDNMFALELFHGPTMCFKDIGARFLARIINYYAADKEREIHILTATSGDSGSAVAEAFQGLDNCRLHILYPQGRLTDRQLTTLRLSADNVELIEVRGTFDDCQSLVHQALNDDELSRELSLTTANTANVMRLIPQMFCYFHAVGQLIARKPHCDAPIISVPTGNAGNLTAGLMAHRMGLPVNRFIAATNANAAVAEYLSSGKYAPHVPVPSLTPAMDVGHVSNLARLEYLFDNDFERIKEMIEPQVVDNQALADTMMSVLCSREYLLDPHSAIACAALSRADLSTTPGIFLATAAPVKYAQTVTQITGQNMICDLPMRPADLKQPVRIAARYPSLLRHLEKSVYKAV